jgi:transcriptional regulator with XRE-family HTH domain
MVVEDSTENVEPLDTLGKRLEYLMQLRGLSWRKLAAAAGVSDTYLHSRKEKGDITLGVARRLCSALDVSMHWLGTGEGPVGPYQPPGDLPAVDIYPNRLRAARAAQTLQLPDQAIATVLRWEPNLRDDRPPEWWYERMHEAAVRLGWPYDFESR